jgi:hypothetical protein
MSRRLGGAGLIPGFFMPPKRPVGSHASTRTSLTATTHSCTSTASKKIKKIKNQLDLAAQQPEQDQHSNMHGNSPAPRGIDEGYTSAYWAEEGGYSVWWLLLVVVRWGWSAGPIMRCHSR